MMALYHRDVHGKPGQVIDLSIFESIFSILGPQVMELDQLGIVQQRFGNRSPRGVPRNAYETSDKRWIAVSASASDMALRLFRAIGRNDMTDDPRYATPAQRLANGDEVDGIVADWIKQRALKEVLGRLEQFRVPAAPIYDIEQIQNDPHYQARQSITQLPDEDLGAIKMTNIPVRFSLTPGKIRHTGRMAIGHDTVDILREIGMTETDIEDLIDRQIVRARGRVAKDIS
jgi:crotonobetainyl-CoA:carnitine CoA-transferase CaiB-like acyl-CoA transferase